MHRQQDNLNRFILVACNVLTSYTCMYDLTCLSLVAYRPQTTCLHPALSCAAAYVFLQLSPDLFSMCFCGPLVSTALLVWQYCHRFSCMCDSKFGNSILKLKSVPYAKVKEIATTGWSEGRGILIELSLCYSIV